jgi:hypothetical protein
MSGPAPAPLPSSRQVPDLAGEDHRQEWRLRHPKDASAASALDGDLARRQDARRGRTARPRLQVAVTEVRDGGDRLAAGAGEQRGGSRPRRASPTLRQRATLPPPSGETPPLPTAGTLACPTLASVIPRPYSEPGRGRTARRAGGAPLMIVKKILTHPALPALPVPLSRSAPKSRRRSTSRVAS